MESEERRVGNKKQKTNSQKQSLQGNFFYRDGKDYEHVTRMSSRNITAFFAKRKQSGIFVSRLRRLQRS
jgi:hypothetical protein